ncbi:polyketide cyclase / dehydrase and lipid transport [bacterium BMS3Bbin11]|nr:polyketide cyclase / dehydrase and lipid transport [bacterium BMS3Abin11]GBE46709.1 polyketide cyclase / dehydrase and lipid transport [bacterium BMS3Bbin11]GMT39491.1 MAG: polyketide cyclase [bacterium]HDZ77680.1 SRPBCC family protein [Gammaproteobacteria bacterium]
MPSIYQSNIINAPIEKVWQAIRDFHDMSCAPNVISSCEAVGEKPGTEVGARRVLNGAFHETLLEVDDYNHYLRYAIDNGPEPVAAPAVTNYIGEIKLTPVTMQDVTLIEWSSSWISDDEDAVSFCHNIYVAVMGDMADTLG